MINRTVIVFFALLVPVFAYGAVEKIQNVTAKSAWTRATPPAAKNGAAYLVLKNMTGRDDVLLSASSEAAGHVEMHESRLNDLGVYTMNKMDRLPIKNGEEISFIPGGFHLMLVGLHAPLIAGNEIALKLTFAHSLPIYVRTMIEPPNYQFSDDKKTADPRRVGQ